MSPTDHVEGRLWLLLPGCRPIQATALPAGIDPATAIGHGCDGLDKFLPGPPPGVAASPAPAKKPAGKAKHACPGMFGEAKKGVA